MARKSKTAEKTKLPSKARLVAAAKDINTSLGLDVAPEGEDTNPDEIPTKGTADVIIAGIKKASALIEDEDELKKDTDAVLEELGLFEDAPADPPAPKTPPKDEPKKAKKGGAKKASPTGKWDPSAKITILAEANPKRAGTASYDRFALYKNGMLVKTAMEKGVTKGDLNWDTSKGFIEIN